LEQVVQIGWYGYLAAETQYCGKMHV